MSGGFATTGGVEWSLYLAFSDSNLVKILENLITALGVWQLRLLLMVLL